MADAPEHIEALIRSVMPDKARSFRRDTDLIDDLGFDSVNLLELISALEERFRLTFADDDLDIAHFRTPERIEQIIALYLAL